MKRLNLSLTVIGVLSCLVSCEGTNEASSSVGNASEVWPYHEGDEMIFVDHYDGLTTTGGILRDTVFVRGNVIIDGKEYQFQEIAHDSVDVIGHGRLKPVNDSEYYRLDASRIYRMSDGLELLLLDLGKNYDPSVHDHVAGYYVKDTTVTSTAGTFADARMVRRDSLITRTLILHPSVGLVYDILPNYNRELESAVISGKRYP